VFWGVNGFVWGTVGCWIHPQGGYRSLPSSPLSQLWSLEKFVWPGVIQASKPSVWGVGEATGGNSHALGIRLQAWMSYSIALWRRPLLLDSMCIINMTACVPSTAAWQHVYHQKAPSMQFQGLASLFGVLRHVLTYCTHNLQCVLWWVRGLLEVLLLHSCKLKLLMMMPDPLRTWLWLAWTCCFPGNVQRRLCWVAGTSQRVAKSGYRSTVCTTPATISRSLRCAPQPPECAVLLVCSLLNSRANPCLTKIPINVFAFHGNHALLEPAFLAE